jgi:hypothetical protein
MKAVKKILKLAVLSIIILFVILGAAFYLFGEYLLKVGIETAATEALSVGVNINDLDILILKGTVEIDGLIVKNPAGYTYENLLELGHGRVMANIGSFLGDTVRIKELKLDGINLVIEQKALSNNLQDVISSIPAEDEQGPEPPGKKLQIDNLEITNVTVKAKLLPVPGKADTITLKLDPIQMTNLGSDDKLDVAKLSGKILLAIATGVAEQGAGLLPEGMTDTMKATLSKTAELGKAAAKEGEKLIEEGKDVGKELVEGFKGLLKPKKEE